VRCYRCILAAEWQDRRTNEEIRAVVQRKETGGYNPNEEAPTVWAYLQDVR